MRWGKLLYSMYHFLWIQSWEACREKAVLPWEGISALKSSEERRVKRDLFAIEVRQKEKGGKGREGK